jgi:hypothetical protein
MNDPNENSSLFQAPHSPEAEEPAPPAIDGSDEARRRLRHPFDTSEASDPGNRPDRNDAHR